MQPGCLPDFTAGRSWVHRSSWRVYLWGLGNCPSSSLPVTVAMQQPKIALCLWLNEVYQIKELVKLNPWQFISLKSDNSLGDIKILSSKNRLNFGTVLYYDKEGYEVKRVDLWKAAIIRVYVHKIWMTQVIGIKVGEFIFWDMTNPKTVKKGASQSNFKR